MLDLSSEEIADRDLISLVLLRRLVLSHDAWCDTADQLSFIAHIMMSNEFWEKNPAFSSGDIDHPEKDLLVKYDKVLVERAFSIFVCKPPSVDEIASLLVDECLSLSRLSSHLCWSVSFMERLFSPKIERSAREYVEFLSKNASYLTQDCFAASQNLIGEGGRSFTRIEFAASRQRIRIEIVTYDDVKADNDLLIKNLENMSPGRDFEITYRSEEDILANGFIPTTNLFITNNNFLYKDFEKIKQLLNDRNDIISACWLFDNHHQIDFSLKIAAAFDFVFPAHATGHTYLYSGKAIVGPVVPCATIQWNSRKASQFYTELRKTPRSNDLYGRFNSYLGRTASRDRFLNRMARELDSNVLNIKKADQQDWFGKGDKGRFADFVGYKSSLCFPIFNDVPIRIFDALLAGQIPIVPFGVPGFEIAIPSSIQRSLPVLTFFYEDSGSLKFAQREAIDLFDAGGVAAADHRHAYALREHMGYRRLSDMISHIIYSVSPAVGQAQDSASVLEQRSRLSRLGSALSGLVKTPR
ncbi:hypothetical protein [Methylobacterium oryzae]|uniref:hypothetical protein n=1 Tax=Methylobacterium oryzae TaxID=334852 RepID=UPI002F34FCE6